MPPADSAAPCTLLPFRRGLCLPLLLVSGAFWMPGFACCRLCRLHGFCLVSAVSALLRRLPHACTGFSVLWFSTERLTAGCAGFVLDSALLGLPDSTGFGFSAVLLPACQFSPPFSRSVRYTTSFLPRSLPLPTVTTYRCLPACLLVLLPGLPAVSRSGFHRLPFTTCLVRCWITGYRRSCTCLPAFVLPACLPFHLRLLPPPGFYRHRSAVFVWMPAPTAACATVLPVTALPPPAASDYRSTATTCVTCTYHRSAVLFCCRQTLIPFLAFSPLRCRWVDSAFLPHDAVGYLPAAAATARRLNLPHCGLPAPARFSFCFTVWSGFWIPHRYRVLPFCVSFHYHCLPFWILVLFCHCTVSRSAFPFLFAVRSWISACRWFAAFVFLPPAFYACH